MDYVSFFQSMPHLFELFIPGFIFLWTYRLFCKGQSDHFESTAIYSLIISFILKLVATLILEKPPYNIVSVSEGIDIKNNLVAILLGFIAALFIVKIKTTEVLKGPAKWLGKTTGNDNIWQDLFDRNLGSRLRCHTNYNNKDATIVGDVKYYEACQDGECNIVLENYTITYADNSFYEPPEEYKIYTPFLYLNSKNFHELEVFHGSPEKRNKRCILRKKRKKQAANQENETE